MFVLQMLPPHHNQQRCPFPAFSPYKETTKATAIGLFLLKLSPTPISLCKLPGKAQPAVGASLAQAGGRDAGLVQSEPL